MNFVFCKRQTASEWSHTQVSGRLVCWYTCSVEIAFIKTETLKDLFISKQGFVFMNDYGITIQITYRAHYSESLRLIEDFQVHYHNLPH